MMNTVCENVSSVVKSMTPMPKLQLMSDLNSRGNVSWCLDILKTYRELSLDLTLTVCCTQGLCFTLSRDQPFDLYFEIPTLP